MRVKILEKFLLSEEGSEFFVRQLTRELSDDPGKDLPINGVNHELKKMKEIGLLRVRSKGGKKFFKVNPDFIFLEELRGIVKKGSMQVEKVAKKIQQSGNLQMLILTGVFTGKEAGIDIFIVGDLDKDKLNK